MLRAVAFANALAILVGLFYLALLGLGVVAPGAFAFLFNAQFLGADVASLLPRGLSLAHAVGVLVTLVATTWLFAYVWAWLYNRLAR